MTISKEAKVGIMSLAAMLMLYFGFNILKGSDIFSKNYTYFAKYSDIDGLTVSNPVLLNGLTVGNVKSIQLMQNEGNSLVVTLEIRKNVNLRSGTKASLADGGLLGGKVIHLNIPVEGNILGEGDTLVSVQTAGIASLLQQKALPVVTHADSLVLNLTAVAVGFKETGEILNNVLRNYNQTGTNINQLISSNEKKIGTLLDNMSTLSASLVATEKELKPLLANANNLVDTLNNLQLKQTLQLAQDGLGDFRKLMADLENGSGSAGKLLKDEELYNNLNYTLISLNQLLANFREHPRRYVNVSVFGKKDKGPSESPIDTTLKFKENQ
jgi:phospholipid/cholesterol/gamma-HCH transport system substrate-binding protein